jgi:small basic protein
MTISSLVAALTVGAVIGVCARWFVTPDRGIPFWVPLAVAIGAAVLGSVTAHLAGMGDAALSVVEVILPVMFATVGVALVIATGDRRPNDSRYDRFGRHG